MWVPNFSLVQKSKYSDLKYIMEFRFILVKVEMKNSILFIGLSPFVKKNKIPATKLNSEVQNDFSQSE